MTAKFISSDHATIRSRGYLPHIEIDDNIYFITFRLADSLPPAVLRKLDDERRDLIRKVAGASRPTFEQHIEIARRYERALDQYLDVGYGSGLLRDSRVAKLVQDSLHFHDRVRYRLICWCVMPNHVHAMIHLFRGSDLSRVIHTWKSYTAHEANRILQRQGRLWEREYFDRLIRDSRDFDRTRDYVLENPAKAGLTNWPWVGAVAAE